MNEMPNQNPIQATLESQESEKLLKGKEAINSLLGKRTLEDFNEKN